MDMTDRLSIVVLGSECIYGNVPVEKQHFEVFDQDQADEAGAKALEWAKQGWKTSLIVGNVKKVKIE